MNTIFPKQSYNDLLKDILCLTQFKNETIYFYGKSQNGLSGINLYIVDDAVHDLWMDYVNHDLWSQFEAYWSKSLSYFSSLKKSSQYSWNVVLIKVYDNCKINIKFIYDEVDKNFDSEDLIKWEYLKLGIQNNLYLLDDKDKNKLLKQPPGNPFKNLD